MFLKMNRSHANKTQNLGKAWGVLKESANPIEVREDKTEVWGCETKNSFGKEN